MKRLFNMGENPADVIKKIDDFISTGENPTTIMSNMGDIIKSLDNTEQVINNIQDSGYRNEMLGYITTARTQVMNVVDSLDSMLEV